MINLFRDRNRSFLKLPKMIMQSSATGEKVEPYMERPLTTHAGAKTAMGPLSTSRIGNGTSASIVTESTSGGEAPPASPLELKQQRMDIDRLMAKFEGLQNDMVSMKTAIDEIKEATQKSSRNSSAHAFAEELELLTENVSHVNWKANEIDRLKLELELMKRRVKRLEEGTIGTQSSHTVTGLTPSSAAPAPRTGKKSGPLARRSRKTSSGHINPLQFSLESIKVSEGRATGSLPHDAEAGQQVVRDSAHLSPTLSDEKVVKKHRVQPENQDLLHQAQSLLSQVQDVYGVPRGVPQPFRSATIEGPPDSQTAHIENLGPGQTQDDSYKPSQDVDMDMDDSVSITQVTDSALGSCLDAPGPPGDVRRSTMTRLPLHSLSNSSPTASTTSPSTNSSSDQMDSSSDQIDEESFRPSDRQASNQPPNPQPQEPRNRAATDSTPPHPLSDPSDTDFRPRPWPRNRGPNSARRSRGGRPRKSEPLRNTTPEWEKPDWPGPGPDNASPYYAYGDNVRGRARVISARGRKVVRRGISGGGGMAGREPVAKRVKVEVGGKGEGAMRDEKGGESPDGRVRDSEGFLLMPSGKRDGRSVRGRRSVGGGGRMGIAKGGGRAKGVDGHERLMRQIFPGRGREREGGAV